ncbi:hypothetical protein C7S16_6238 [Burkholderia thailandensis]|uniref:Uncharacterized protein n=1 Tax=Burkholderia thailandensis TaxID=57975 RepID=A0AAW9CR00_BURTH|nr:hypothetical protein [Burkholderia thailandensis]MDW9253343.1 hypothetical protein [Burkholderia thailandensis]
MPSRYSPARPNANGRTPRRAHDDRAAAGMGMGTAQRRAPQYPPPSIGSRYCYTNIAILK